MNNEAEKERIRYLADAISSTALYFEPGDEYRIRNWATEIIMHCDTIAKKKEGGKKNIQLKKSGY